MTEPPIEAELKYRAERDEPITRLRETRTLGPAQLGPGRSYRELDRYLDTAGGRLAAARWACRLRRREEQQIVSLKGPARHAPGAILHLRPELEGPAGPGLDPGTWPDSPARAFLDTLRDGEPLIERLRLDQRRTERPVEVAGRLAGTLSLDACSVIRNGTVHGDLRVVELELLEDAYHLADVLGMALAALPGLVAEPLSKLERALALIGEPA